MNRLLAPAPGGLRLAALLAVVVAGAPDAMAGGGELALLGVRQVTAPMTQALQRFERDTGQPVVTQFTSPARLRTTIGAAEHPDLMVASDEDMEALEKTGALESFSRVALGRIGELPDRTCYAVAILAEAPNRNEARKLIRYLAEDAARLASAAHGASGEQTASCSH